MAEPSELDLDGLQADDGSTAENWREKLQDAIDLASDQDQMTWIKSNGRRIAAIVSVADGELVQALFTVESAHAVITRPDGTQITREWTNVGPTAGGITLLPPPSSRDPEGQQ